MPHSATLVLCLLIGAASVGLPLLALALRRIHATEGGRRDIASGPTPSEPGVGIEDAVPARVPRTPDPDEALGSAAVRSLGNVVNTLPSDARARRLLHDGGVPEESLPALARALRWVACGQTPNASDLAQVAALRSALVGRDDWSTIEGEKRPATLVHTADLLFQKVARIELQPDRGCACRAVRHPDLQ